MCRRPLNVLGHRSAAALSVGHAQVVVEPGPALSGSLAAYDSERLFVSGDGLLNIVGSNAVNAGPICRSQGAAHCSNRPPPYRS